MANTIVFNTQITHGPAERDVRSISDLVAGDALRIGYRGWQPRHNDVFLGFSIEGDATRYASKRELPPGTNMDDVRAKFRHHEGDDSYDWDAYRFKGRWAVGSSADTAQLHNPILVLSAGPTRVYGVEG